MSYANNGDNEIERMRQRRLASRIAAENGVVMDLSSLKHNQLPEVSTRNGKKYQQPSRPVIANLGDPPDGQEWPTHAGAGHAVEQGQPRDQRRDRVFVLRPSRQRTGQAVCVRQGPA